MKLIESQNILSLKGLTGITEIQLLALHRAAPRITFILPENDRMVQNGEEN